MVVLTVKIDAEIVNAFKHFEGWISLSQIAKTLRITYPKTERICWTLAGKGVVFWKPGKGREQLFRYNKDYGRKKEANILHEIDKLLGRDYYITGETALFLHNLTDHAMYQRLIELALPKTKYNELADKLVENLNRYATILPHKIPKHCNKDNILTDALEVGDVVVLRKAVHNPRMLKFHGDLNLPGMKFILEEVDLPDKELFEYTLRALDLNLTEEEFKELCQRKHDLVYLKKYLEGDKNIPDNILNAIKQAARNVRRY